MDVECVGKIELRNVLTLVFHKYFMEKNNTMQVALAAIPGIIPISNRRVGSLS